jgi:hypothetical protein
MMTMNKNTKCVVRDPATAELHDLYKKHEYRAISERNVIEFCAGCGSWVVHADRDDPESVPLLPRDFGDTGPFRLWKVMSWLSPEQRVALATYLKANGYGSKDSKRREELSAYLEAK